jgi:4-amino-4-deoxychorismate lyase
VKCGIIIAKIGRFRKQGNGVILINGQQCKQLDVSDRGLHYGDGLFETLAVRNGKPELWRAHMARLAEGCVRLGIAEPDQQVLLEEAKQLCHDSDRAVLKIIVTRGTGGRGYRPPSMPEPTRIVAKYPWPEYADDMSPYHLRFCQTPLGCNPALAGIKHLNRLEQVLARNEWDDDSIHEGLMCDRHGNVIEGISSNLFAVRDGALLTPETTHCGVDGVMREKVLALAKELGIPSAITTIHRDEITRMDGLFITNSIVGIRPVVQLAQTHYRDSMIITQLVEALPTALEEIA